MRISAFLALFSTFGLLCISRAADIPLKNFDSAVDLIEEHRHIHLGDDDNTTGSHDNETYATENPHKHHHHQHGSTTAGHKHDTTQFQSTEPEVTDFFNAASKGAVYDETPEKKHESHDDAHGKHMHHMRNAEDLKLLRAQKAGSHMDNMDNTMDHSMNHMDHTMETGHEGHTMETNHNMHTMDDHGNHAGHDHHMKMDMNGTGMHHMMMMYFHTGVNEIVLFKEWTISTVGGLLGSMVGVFLLAVIYEGLKYFREHLFKRYVSSIQFSTVAVTGASGRVTQVHKVERHHMMSWPHAVQTLLHVVQIILSYFLMLIFMTYNVWLCLAVVLGAGFGYFIFGWKKASVVDITEHCH